MHRMGSETKKLCRGIEYNYSVTIGHFYPAVDTGNIMERINKEPKRRVWVVRRSTSKRRVAPEAGQNQPNRHQQGVGDWKKVFDDGKMIRQGSGVEATYRKLEAL